MLQWNMDGIMIILMIIAYIVSDEKSRELDGVGVGVVSSTNLALSELISNALPDIKAKDTNCKSGLMAIGENVCIRINNNIVSN